MVIRIRKALADPDAKLTQTVKIIGAEPRMDGIDRLYIRVREASIGMESIRFTTWG